MKHISFESIGIEEISLAGWHCPKFDENILQIFGYCSQIIEVNAQFCCDLDQSCLRTLYLEFALRIFDPENSVPGQAGQFLIALIGFWR